MPLIAVIGDQVAAGNLVSPPATTVLINKQPVCMTPAVVSPHGDAPHSSATVATGKATRLKVQKKFPVLDGDTATCGDSVKVTKQSTVFGK